VARELRAVYDTLHESGRARKPIESALIVGCPAARLLQAPPAGRDAMKLSIESAALLLLIAAVVAMLTRRLRLPYSAGLVAPEWGWRSCRFSPGVSLTRNSCSRRFFLR